MKKESLLLVLVAVVLSSNVLFFTPGCQKQEQVNQQASSQGKITSNSLPQKVEAIHLPNAYRFHPKVISGGLPADAAAFQELHELGIKTIISVDGATPDVELAKKFGLRYVHLPHGYDGVPAGRASELAKAVRDLPGPIYIHCHHGKHRSPAAAAVACIGAGLLLPDNAELMLKTAGTDPKYQGLYQSAAAAQPLASSVLDELQVEFKEKAKIPPLAEAMVAIEHLHDNLKRMSQDQWKSPANHPDLTAAHESLLLQEQFKELIRTKEVSQFPVQFQKMLSDSESILQRLEQLLNAASLEKPLNQAQATDLLSQVTFQCNACHKQYRDQPLQQKLAR